MAAFEYEALDGRGRTRRGVVSADTARLARRELKRRHLVPLKLVATDAPAAKAGADAGEAGGQAAGAPGLATAGLAARLAAPLAGLRPAPRLSAKEVVLVTRQLATLISAAAPVEEALNTVALQSDRPLVRKVLLSVRAQVMEGQRLADALARHPDSFSALYRSMVAAGEASGSLGPVMERLADYLERTQAMRAKVVSALVYPAFLSVTALGVVVLLMAFVVPKVAEQFDHLGQALPWLTRAMMALAEALQAYGLWALLTLLGLGLVAVRALRRPGVRERVDRWVLALPLVGRLAREMNAARLARTLATLIASGTPVLEGLAAARNTLANSYLKASLSQVIAQVREGSGLAGALRKTGAFPPLVVYMAAMGEKGGRLDEMLGKAADYMEAEFEDVTRTALSLLEPAIIVVMGGAVGLIVLAIMLPILQLNTLAL
ncbi:type II secretion system protein GspF [Rhodothalassium salexigens]|uniref:type II secretion system inner membrane protein GspF n=1 Tax=Rhodothalassium salexigens TaxID=1086 RepID=UPI001911DFB4|nr:type II secretion system inner membrane protein GspF [Rhodothalassium salexigens]MBK5920934.1 type II secretion system protein GspF [Rhodothalassium salexigens]